MQLEGDFASLPQRLRTGAGLLIAHPSNSKIQTGMTLQHWRNLGAMTLGVTSVVLGLQLVGSLQLLEWTVFDRWFRLRSPEVQPLPIVLVTIRESDIQEIGQWPLSDAQLATLLRKLKQADPAVIGLNLYRDLPIAPGQAELQQVFATTPNLIGVKKAVGNFRGAAVSAPPALIKRDQIAINDFVVDSDGTVRRNLLSVNSGGKTTLALGARLAMSYLAQQQITPQAIDTDGTYIRLGKATFRPLRGDAGGYVRADVGGYQMLSNFLRTPTAIPVVSLSQVLADRVPAELLRNKIVLIDSQAESLWGNRFHTPYTTDAISMWTAGELQANLALQMIASALTGRPLLQGVPEVWEWGWILVCAGVGTLLGWSLRSVQGAVVWISVILLSLLSLTYGLFLWGWWLVLVSPLLALSATGLLSRGYWVWQRLQETNQALELKVAARTQELVEKNLALEQARLAADAANRAKTLFLANMSHELRTPLTAILGFSDLMSMDAALDDSQQENLSVIKRSGEHLLDLINDVLEMSKIEAGKIALNAECCDLVALVKNLREMLCPKAIAKGLQFRTQIDRGVPRTVCLDSRRLRQVLINLLTNAIKFTDQGGVVLRVAGVRSPTGSEPLPDSHAQPCLSQVVAAPDGSQARPDLLPYWLQFVVEDTGVGIAASELEQLFQPFIQTESGRRLGQGTGLGLSISQRLVQLMGGTIAVESTVGVGSRFWFAIPVEAIEPGRPKRNRAQFPVTLALGQPPYRILVVDNMPENRQLLVKLLRPLGFEVQEADDGATAIATWQSWQPHLICMDMKLSQMDGCEATRQIRTRERQRQEAQPLHPSSDSERPQPTIVLALTADAFGHSPQEMLAAGCNDVLYKPFQPQELLDKIAQQLGVKHETSPLELQAQAGA